MCTVYLNTFGSSAGVVSERLRITFPEKDKKGHPGESKRETRDIPFDEIDRIFLLEHVAMSIPAIAACMRRAIPIIVTTTRDSVVGSCLGPAPHAAIRKAQYICSESQTAALSVARSLIEAKVYNQRRLLQRAGASRDHDRWRTSAVALTGLLPRIARAETREALFGHEGAAAAAYFEGYATLFPEHCPFVRRSRRPPANPPNAVMSYAYALMTAEIECLLHASGLDPSVGLYHETTDRRAALALDLLEIFRAPVGDALALDLFSHRKLNPDKHFESQKGGVWLTGEGKKVFFAEYDRRMGREFHHEQTDRRTTLRKAIEDGVRSLKHRLKGERADPFFKMN